MRRQTIVHSLLCVAVLAAPAAGQNISTFAGGGPLGAASAVQVALGNPHGVVDDGAGGFYVASQLHNQIFRVDASGTLTVVAGQGAAGFGGDGGPALSALLRTPFALARDGAGNLYFSDVGNRRIRKIDTGGMIQTVAGTGVFGSAGDGGPATSAQLQDPRGLAVDAAGDLYLADFAAHRVRRVSTLGIITTIAGTGVAGFSGDGGSAAAAQVNGPWGLVIDSGGSLYVSDFNNHRVRRIDSAGTISTYAGTGTAAVGASPESGSAGAIPIRFPMGLARDAAGNVYLGDQLFRIMRVDASGNISRVGGNKSSTFSGDGGPATSAGIGNAQAVSTSGGGLVLTDGFQRVRRVDVTSTITTAAGNGRQNTAGVGGPALAAQVYQVSTVAAESAGTVLFADRNRVWRVTAAGNLVQFAGSLVSESSAFSGDGGPALGAGLVEIWDIAFDSAGATYFADRNRIRKVDPSGIITTIVGTGVAGFNGDGLPGPLTQVNFVRELEFDSAGNLLFTDFNNNRVRKLDIATGVVSTFAGTGVAGFSGDSGPATAAMLRFPTGLARAADGSIYLGDQGNDRVRQISPAGTIQTIANVNDPGALDVDAAGNVLIATENNHTVRRIGPSGGASVIVAGTGTLGFSGDGGPAVTATLANVADVAVGGDGSLYIADFFNRRVRRVSFNQAPIADAGEDQSVEASGAATPVTLDGAGSSDPEGTTLAHTWRDGGGAIIGTTASLVVSLGLGTHSFSLTVSDGVFTASDTIVVTVEDTTAPAIDAPETLTIACSATDVAGHGCVLATHSTIAAWLGSVSAEDAVDPSPALTHDAPASFPLGSTTVTFAATDDTGNVAQATAVVRVVYGFSGFEPPLAHGGVASIKQGKSGRTIPVKFSLTCGNAAVGSATATIAVYRVLDVDSGTIDVTNLTADSGSSSDNGNLFRYDPVSLRYIYNLSTHGFAAPSTYRIVVTLDDGTEHAIDFSLKP